MTENEAIGQLKYMYKTCMDEKCKHKGQCDLCCESRDMAIQALEEIQQYRALGTVEELRVAREKQIARKTEVIDKFYDEVRKCPSCGDIVEYYGKEFYCEKCGQKLKWGD